MPIGDPAVWAMVDISVVARGIGGALTYATGRSEPGAVVTADTVITAVGDFQDRAGCAVNDDPSCLSTRLTDSDGNGIWTWTSPPLREGSYSVAVSVDGTRYGRDLWPGASPHVWRGLTPAASRFGSLSIR